MADDIGGVEVYVTSADVKGEGERDRGGEREREREGSGEEDSDCGEDGGGEGGGAPAGNVASGTPAGTEAGGTPAGDETGGTPAGNEEGWPGGKRFRRRGPLVVGRRVAAVRVWHGRPFLSNSSVRGACSTFQPLWLMAACSVAIQNLSYGRARSSHCAPGATSSSKGSGHPRVAGTCSSTMM